LVKTLNATQNAVAEHGLTLKAHTFMLFTAWDIDISALSFLTTKRFLSFKSTNGKLRVATGNTISDSYNLMRLSQVPHKISNRHLKATSNVRILAVGIFTLTVYKLNIYIHHHLSAIG